ncbi:MAG TPA: hypothetical protein EYG50_01660 [Cycloclasticus sp.]|nr:hypothetical protein [Cycloclasticus sp.]HIL91451.1 hypothetical protein [Cycloclasticus sp.]
MLDIWPDYIEAYARTGHGLCRNLDDFNDQSNVSLVELEFESWQVKFERAERINDSNDLDINWVSFHQEDSFLFVI